MKAEARPRRPMRYTSRTLGSVRPMAATASRVPSDEPSSTNTTSQAMPSHGGAQLVDEGGPRCPARSGPGRRRRVRATRRTRAGGAWSGRTSRSLARLPWGEARTGQGRPGAPPVTQGRVGVMRGGGGADTSWRSSASPQPHTPPGEAPNRAQHGFLRPQRAHQEGRRRLRPGPLRRHVRFGSATIGVAAAT